MENKAIETLGHAYASFMHAYAYMSMHTHARVPKTMKDKFSTLKLRFRMNPTSSGSRSKPPFSQYKKAIYDTFSKHTKNPKGQLKIH